MDTTELLKRYAQHILGAGEVAAHMGKTMGVQALSGIKGLSEFPNGMDAAADAVRAYQEAHAPGDLGPNGIDYIQKTVAPLYNSATHSPAGVAMHALSAKYGEGSQELSDLAGKYLGPTAAGVVGAAADVAPMAITEGGLLGAGAEDIARQVPSYVKARVGDHFIAMDPQTGEHVAHVTTGMGDGVVHHLESAGHPEVEKDLIHDAIADAHAKGLPYHVPEPTPSMLDIPGGEQTPGGLVFPKQASADDAVVGENPHFDPNGHADGGLIADDLAKLVAKYAPVMKSIEETNGATYHPGTGNMPPAGYAVSLHKGREAISPSVNPTDIHNFIQSNQDAFSADPGAHLGAWKNPKDGQTYLDVSHVDPDFGSAVKKAQTNNQLAIFDLAHKDEIPTTPDYMHFVHYSNLNDPKVTLDPKFYGEGIKGAEASRGGTKTVSLYPADIAQPEQGLEGKAKYRVTVPTSSMYDMSADPQGLRSGAASFSDAEDAVKGAGYAGYHAPGGVGIFQGQARMFGPTEATQIAPAGRSTPSEAETAFKPAKKSVVYDDTADTSDFAEGGEVGPVLDDVGKKNGPAANDMAKGGPVKMADGGSLALDDIGALVAKYAKTAAPETVPDQAAHLLSKVADEGSATFNPTTGDLHSEGYAVPHDINRSASFDSALQPQDVHDFLLSNQDVFDNPKAVLHIERDSGGNHYLHVAHVEPDFDSALAAAKAFDAPGVRDLKTGQNFPADGPAPLLGSSPVSPEENEYFNDNKAFSRDQLVNETVASRPLTEYERINSTPIPRTNWTPGKQTVANPVRNFRPGVYGPTKDVVDEAAAIAAKSPENPMMERLFGRTRQDLADIGAGRQGNLLGQPLGYTSNPGGSASAQNIMVPKNAQRLVDALDYARTKPELSRGMTGWYIMDPAYQRLLHLTGDETQAKKLYDQLNTFQSVSSPQTPVPRELEIAATAHWLKNSGRWSDYENMADAAKHGQNPSDLQDLMTHIYHNSQNVPAMNRYNERGVIGSVPMDAPKAYVYGEASNIPDIGQQTRTPIGDTHFSGALGLLDTRTRADPKGSVSTEELQTLAPWFRSQVADRAGYESVPAQANLWGIFAPQTGVRSGIGMPKLELMTQDIMNVASRYGVSPETARDMYLLGRRP